MRGDGPGGPVPVRPPVSGRLWLLAGWSLLVWAGACGTAAPGRHPLHVVAAATADGRVELKVGPPIDVKAILRRWEPVSAMMRDGMGDTAFRDMMRDYDRTHPLWATLRNDLQHTWYDARLRCRDGPVTLWTGCVLLTVRDGDGRLVTCRDDGILGRVRDDASRLQDSRRRPVVLDPAWDPAAAADGIYKLVLRCTVRGEVVAVALDSTRIDGPAAVTAGDGEHRP